VIEARRYQNIRVIATPSTCEQWAILAHNPAPSLFDRGVMPVFGVIAAAASWIETKLKDRRSSRGYVS
jgi:hypothetical protein